MGKPRFCALNTIQILISAYEAVCLDDCVNQITAGGGKGAGHGRWRIAGEEGGENLIFEFYHKLTESQFLPGPRITTLFYQPTPSSFLFLSTLFTTPIPFPRAAPFPISPFQVRAV
jgi:hypothetical protein